MFKYLYLPYFYTSKAKLNKKGRFLSYFIILVIPAAYFALILQTDFTVEHLLFVILGSIYVQNLYEIGYIQNDTETIKKEVHPTIRIGKDARDYYEEHKLSIYGFRAVIAVLLAGILWFVSGQNTDILYFLSVATLITPIFLIYNNIRNGWNLLLHFILATLKYTAVQFLFFDTMHTGVFLLSVFAYPVMNLLDRAATPRFFKSFSEYYIPRRAKCRMVYYGILSLICCILWYTNQMNVLSMLIVAYYFLYRLAIVITNTK